MDVYAMSPEHKQAQPKIKCRHYREYMDHMKLALNQNAENNLFPYWRSHHSLKGWSSMNYPSVLQNPGKLARQQRTDISTAKFSNVERPLTSSPGKQLRPLTSAAKRIIERRCIADENKSNTPNRTFRSHRGSFPMTPGTNRSYALQDSSQMEESMISESALDKSNFQVSTGMLATETYEARAAMITRIHGQSNNRYGTLKPATAYLGPKLDFLKGYSATQIDDIHFEDDADGNGQGEDLANLKRLPKQILTESSLKRYLTPALEAINLEKHYWIRDPFIQKMGYLIPNIRELCLRGLSITDTSLTTLLQQCKYIEKLNLSECNKLTSNSLKMIGEYSLKLEELYLYSCLGVDDLALRSIGSLSEDFLHILDISCCSSITDAGLGCLEKFQFTILKLNSLENITQDGVVRLLEKSASTLLELQLGLLNPENFTDDIIPIGLSKCENLEYLDITGLSQITDTTISEISEKVTKNYKGTLDHEDRLVNLRELKLNSLEQITDSPLIHLCTKNKKLEVLELSKCSSLTEAAITDIVKSCPMLKVLEINLISEISIEFVEELRKNKPNIKIIRFANQLVDPYDDGMRIPWVPLKKKKKGKKKGKKKKK